MLKVIGAGMAPAGKGKMQLSSTISTNVNRRLSNVDTLIRSTAVRPGHPESSNWFVLLSLAVANPGFC